MNKLFVPESTTKGKEATNKSFIKSEFSLFTPTTNPNRLFVKKDPQIFLSTSRHKNISSTCLISRGIHSTEVCVFTCYLVLVDSLTHEPTTEKATVTSTTDVPPTIMTESTRHHRSTTSGIITLPSNTKQLILPKIKKRLLSY